MSAYTYNSRVRNATLYIILFFKMLKYKNTLKTFQRGATGTAFFIFWWIKYPSYPSYCERLVNNKIKMAGTHTKNVKPFVFPFLSPQNWRQNKSQDDKNTSEFFFTTGGVSVWDVIKHKRRLWQSHLPSNCGKDFYTLESSRPFALFLIQTNLLKKLIDWLIDLALYRLSFSPF